MDGNNSDNILIENLLISEGVAASIIENYDIIGMYMCTQCGNEIKNGENTTREDVISHVMTHTTYTGLAGIYMCHLCNEEFKSDEDRKEHILIHYENENKEESDSEYDEQDYPYSCPICFEGYETQGELGEHFMEEHGEYDELGMLDEVESESYPTFEVLQKIGMMRFIKPNDEIKETECSICCSMYNKRKRSKTDMELEYIQPYNKFLQFYCDMQIIFINNIEKVYVEPIQLLCCKTIMCSNCLIQHIKSKKGEPECPYCRKNHTQYNKKYIVFDERPFIKRL